MSAQWAQFLRVTFTQLMLTCAQSAALVLMFAQAAQFPNKIAMTEMQNPQVRLGIFFFLLKCYLDVANLEKKLYLCSVK